MGRRKQSDHLRSVSPLELRHMLERAHGKLRSTDNDEESDIA
jgi:hypothetical protein